jgi:outer membrane cobalamin receptor
MLKPERTRQLGLGATWQGRLGKEGPALRFSIDGYYNDLTDKISSVPYNLFVWRTENRGKVIVKGVDATLQLNQRLAPRHTLLLSANYSLQDAADRTSPTDNSYGKQSAYLPRHSGAAHLVWENPWLNCGLNFSGASSRWATNNHAPSTRLSGYGELGATFYRNFNLPTGVLKTSLSLHNLLNKNYEIVRRYPMPTRRFVITLTYSI